MFTRPSIALVALVVATLCLACEAGSDEPELATGDTSTAADSGSSAAADRDRDTAADSHVATDAETDAGPGTDAAPAADAQTLSDYTCAPHGENTRVHGTFSATLNGEPLGPFNVFRGGLAVNFGLTACDVGRVIRSTNVPNWTINVTTREIEEHGSGSVAVGPGSPFMFTLVEENTNHQPGDPPRFDHVAVEGGSGTLSAFEFVQGSDDVASGSFAGQASFQTDSGHSVEVSWDVSWGG